MVLSILAGLMTPLVIGLGVVLAARRLPRWSPTAGRGVGRVPVLGLGLGVAVGPGAEADGDRAERGGA
ncbi:hypothetical protein ACIA5D_18315 [Actinoplanes sp. NPDC051513]|uniref:hypothetical protein n=1 Tax=Actinoplanes sp. NPDC051513 TaxID=3363908 RepID=UPI0037A3CB1A